MTATTLDADDASAVRIRVVTSSPLRRTRPGGISRCSVSSNCSSPEELFRSMPARTAAQRYSAALTKFFKLAPGEMPRLDVIHRGMGPDAHTASLFPGEPLIDDRDNLVAAVYVEKMTQWRITLLPGVLLAAQQTVMLVAGEDKAEAVRAILDRRKTRDCSSIIRIARFGCSSPMRSPPG